MQAFYDSPVAADFRYITFGRHPHIIVFQGMKAIAHGIQFSNSGVAVVFKDADKRCNADTAYELVLGVLHIIGLYILVIDHGVYPEIIGGLEAEIAECIVSFVTGAHKNAGLVGIDKGNIISG